VNAACSGTSISPEGWLSLSPAATIADPRRDAYAHAFIRFALEAAHRLAGNPRHLRHAAAIDRFIGARLTGQHYSGLWSAAPAPGCTKLQNPLMHLFEAYLFLHCAAPAGPYLAKAGALGRLPEWRQ
jgi:mannose-6-phosphate isomerase